MHEQLQDRKLQSSMFPEPVRVLRVLPMGQRYRIEVEGLRSHEVHRRMLSQADLEELAHALTQHPNDFRADPVLFALGLEARRLQLGYTFDPFFAVSSSRIDPLPHQLEAVYGVLLKRPRIRFLLADDPGAGKTVMAGLLLKELRYRRLLDRVLIVTPANLTDQWRREMRDKFGEDFAVLNRDVAGLAYGENPWQRQRMVVTSMDFAKREPHLGALRETHWDLVIVDESHRLSASRYGDDIKRSQRYRLGEVLSQNCDHLLLLTATPHQGDDEKFRLLLDLLEPDLFATTELLREAANKGENPVMLRRLKEDMTDFGGKPLFPPRHVHTPQFGLSPGERELYSKVTDYVQRHFQTAWTDKRRNVGLAMTVLQRRLASSTHAIARSLENRLNRLQALREDVSKLQDDPLLGHSEEEIEELPEDERWALEDRLAERLTLARNLPQLDAEIRELQDLSRRARTLARLEQDRKLQVLLGVLGGLGGEKLLVFTEHKDTLNFLVGVLEKQGYAVTHIHGGMNLEERVSREREFRDSAQVMVATEAAGEGINLQFCSVMVNYDLPWNPTRLEQRMGRIHRYGQRYEVHIHNLIAEGTREGEVLALLLRKLEAMRQQLGSDRVYDVVGELLGDVDLEKLMIEHLAGRRSLAEIQAVIEARLAPERVDYLREVTLEALAQRNVDLSRLREDREHSERVRVHPEYTARFFLQALRYLGGSAVQRSPAAPGPAVYALRVPFELRSGNSTLQGEYPRVTFDKGAAHGAEFLAPGHPLFDQVLQETLARAAPALQQGATFALDGLDDSALVAFYELAVVDGQGHTASRRLYAVQGPLEGDTPPAQVPTRVLIDALPAPELAAEPPAPPAARVAGLENWLLDTELETFEAEVRHERLHEVGIRERYGRRSLEHLVGVSVRKLLAHKSRALQGEDMGLAVAQEERQLARLQERQRQFAAEQQQAAQLMPEPAELLGVALLRPLPAASEPGTPHQEDPALRRTVELAAMRVAMRHEQVQGRTPHDVSAENVGYDIRSEGKAQGDGAGQHRYIEVKGRSEVGAVILTPNEWITAGRLGTDYYLYIVTHALSDKPVLTVLQDPAATLTPGEEIRVHYVISAEQWQRAGRKAGGEDE